MKDGREGGEGIGVGREKRVNGGEKKEIREEGRVGRKKRTVEVWNKGEREVREKQIKKVRKTGGRRLKLN
jgi:hypothetical protein